MIGQNFGAITNSIKSDLHSHWLLQLFVSANGKLVINVDGEEISCKAIAVNANIIHEFYTEDLIHFTMLVHPTSQLGRSMRTYFLKNNPYYILSEDRAVELQLLLLNTVLIKKSSNYADLIKSVVSYFDNDTLTAFDPKIKTIIKMIDSCDSEKTPLRVKYLAKAMYLSESRISHLFKEETGIPLKSYIVLHNLQKVYQKIFNGESITDAAIASGFDSSAHFAFTNKKMTGMSARDIIKDSRFLKVSL